MNYRTFTMIFDTEESILQFLVNHWHNGVISCKHCGSQKIYKRKKMPKLYMCKICNNHFSLLSNTVFERSSTDLRKWFYIMFAYYKNPKLRALRIKDELDVTYKTAWKMVHDIKKDAENREKFNTIAKEIDDYFLKWADETEKKLRSEAT